MSIAEQLESRVWDIQRFGLRPTDFRHRVRPSGPKIHLVSVPKAGTHLLERILCLYPGVFRRLIPSLNPWNVRRYGGPERVLRTTRPGRVLVTHLHFQPEIVAAAADSNVVNLFMIRDPRSVAVSKAHYLLNNARHPYHEAVRGLSFGDVLARVVQGDESDPERLLLPAAEELRRFSGWLGERTTITVRYEDLMQFSEDRTQLERAEVARIFAACGLVTPEDLVDTIARSAVSPVSRTYRRPQLRSWESLSTDQLQFLEASLADPVNLYGYNEYWER